LGDGERRRYVVCQNPDEAERQREHQDRLAKLRKDIDAKRPLDQTAASSDHGIVGGFLTSHQHASGGVVEILHLDARRHDRRLLGNAVPVVVLERASHEEEVAVPDADGEMFKKGACKWPLWRACKRAGLRRIGWHVLRHTFASHLAMRGVPLKAIQELLGHATIEMTMRYAHLAPAVHRDAVAQLDGPVPHGHQMGTEEEMRPR
jgi:hypothetical protein